MKIGVFGDSFCDSTVGDNSVKWWHLLENYGHQVIGFGEVGASLIYTSEQIRDFAENFDFIIWTVTEPTRLSIKIDEDPEILHFTRSDHSRYNSYRFKPETNLKIKIAIDYHKHIFDPEQHVFVGECIVRHFLNCYNNLMVIPCFYDPLGHPKFNLWDLNEWEARFYFPELNVIEIYEQYIDKRPCHLSLENNQILAHQVAGNLNSGIFQTEYDFFKPPTEPLDFYWQKR